MSSIHLTQKLHSSHEYKGKFNDGFAFKGRGGAGEFYRLERGRKG